MEGLTTARAPVAGRARFGVLLLSAMGVATFTASVIGILASWIVRDFGVSREQLGYIVMVNILVAAAASPSWGRMADRIGGRWSLTVVFALSAAAYLATASVPLYGALVVGALLGGVAGAGANPATNKLISTHIEAGNRGVITGVKQSGVHVALFVGGALVPIGADAVGWRPILVVVAVASALAVGAVLRLIPTDPAGNETGPVASDVPLAPAMKWLTLYGGLLGFGGAVTFFIPLYAAEGLGMSDRAGGLALGLSGLAAVGARIGWARYAERRVAFLASLAWIAVLATAAALLLATASSMTWLLWPGVILIGLGASSWNSVGMLAVMTSAGSERSGRASGLVMVGFLLGTGLAPPIYGRTVDVTGGYGTMWGIALVVFGAAVLLVAVWARAPRAAIVPS